MNDKNMETLYNRVIFMPKNSTKIDFKSIPYSIQFGYSPKGDIDKVRIYGSDGYTLYDYDFNDHGNSKTHNFSKYNGAHKHKYTIVNGITIDKTTEALTDYDYNTYIKPYLNN